MVEKSISPVFLTELWTAPPPAPGLPGDPVFLLSRLLKKLARTPSFAAAPWKMGGGGRSEIVVRKGLPFIKIKYDFYQFIDVM